MARLWRLSIEKIDDESDELGRDETSGFDAYAPADYDAGLVDENIADPDIYDEPDLDMAGSDALATIEGEQLFADDGAGEAPAAIARARVAEMAARRQLTPRWRAAERGDPTRPKIRSRACSSIWPNCARASSTRSLA